MDPAGGVQAREEGDGGVRVQETHHHLLAPLQGEGADERDQQRQEAHRDLPREPEVVATGGPAVAAEAQQHLHAAPAGQGAGREEGEG